MLFLDKLLKNNNNGEQKIQQNTQQNPLVSGANQVFSGGKKFKITYADGRTLPIFGTDYDRQTDLVVLRHGRGKNTKKKTRIPLASIIGLDSPYIFRKKFTFQNLTFTSEGRELDPKNDQVMKIVRRLINSEYDKKRLKSRIESLKAEIDNLTMTGDETIDKRIGQLKSLADVRSSLNKGGKKPEQEGIPPEYFDQQRQ